MTPSNYELFLEKHKKLLSKYNSKTCFYKKALFRDIISVLLTVLWCVFWLDAAIKYYSLAYVGFSFTNPRIYIMPVIIFLLGLYFFKPYRIFTDKSILGEITDISFTKSPVQRKNKGYSDTRFPSGYAIMTITSPFGKIVRKKVIAYESILDIYRTGNKVSCIRGVQYPVVLESQVTPQNKIFCTNCASFEKDIREKCSVCHAILWNK